jgi:hypothetical protein
MTGSALTSGLSNEAKTSSASCNELEVGESGVVVGTSVAAWGVSVGTAGGGGIAVGVGSADGAGAHPPSAVETANETTKSILIRLILSIATDLLTHCRER